MNTPANDSPLAGIRTLAKDMASKRPPKPETSEPATPAKPVAISADRFVSSAGSNSTYQKPTAYKKAAAPIPVPTPTKEDKTLAETSLISKIETPVPKPLIEEKEVSPLKPISGPKKVSEPTIVVDNEDAASATIIRDTKKDRFKLLPAILTSLRKYFSDINEKYFTKKAPKYTVPDATLRKGVIQQATSLTGKVATFDRSSLQAKIRERQDRAIPKPKAIDKPLKIWTANTEPGYALLEAPEEETESVWGNEQETQIKNVQVVPKKSFRTPPAPVLDVTPPAPIEPKKINPPTPAATLESAPKKWAAPSTKPLTRPVVTAPTLADKSISRTEPEIKPAPLPSEEPVVETVVPKNSPRYEVIDEPEPEPQPEPEPAKTLVRREATPRTAPVTLLKPTRLREWLFTINTNRMSVGITGIVVALLLLGLAGYWWISSYLTNIEIVVMVDHPVVLDAPLQTLFSREINQRELTALINQNLSQSQFPVLQLALSTNAEGDALLDTILVAGATNLKLGTVFAQSVNALYFGILNKSTPFIAMQISDETTARGGMLAWESTMYEDLSLLFSLTNTDEVESRFKDSEVAGFDVRTLVDRTGNEVLVYSLTKQNVLIVTTNETALAELITYIKD